MSSWTGVLDLQRRSRRNALHAAAALQQRLADDAEAQRAAVAAASENFLEGAHHEPPHRSVSPDPPAER